MSIHKLILSYLFTAIVFFAIDITWLGLIARGLYRKYLGDFLSDTVNWPAALVFYFLFIIGIFIFCIMPAIEKQSVSRALIMGALFGFFTYATYDLTNLATLRNWPLTIVFVDILWGMFLTATVSISGFFITKWIS